MKIDMHTHCLPVSRCAHHQPEEFPAIFQSKGMDGFVLTNHCYPYHCDSLGTDPSLQAQMYLDTFRRCQANGEKIGVRVFFGVELKLIKEPCAPEFLLYGIAEETFLQSFPLYDLSLKELFFFCEKNDILLIQAHPFRTKNCFTQEDMQYIHGLEVYNSHPHNDPRFADTYQLALQYGKCMTAGSDFHHISQAGSAGMTVPDSVCDQFMLRDHIRGIFALDEIILA